MQKAATLPAFPTTPESYIKQLDQEYWNSIQETLLKQTEFASKIENESSQLSLFPQMSDLLAELASMLTGDEKKALLELITQLNESSSFNLFYFDDPNSTPPESASIDYPSDFKTRFYPEQYKTTVPGMLYTPTGGAGSSSSKSVEKKAESKDGTSYGSSSSSEDKPKKRYANIYQASTQVGLPKEVVKKLGKIDFTQNDLRRLARLSERINFYHERARKRRDSARQNESKYCDLMEKSTLEDDQEVYGIRSGLFAIYALLNQQLMTLLEQLKKYVYCTTSYQIPSCETLDFPLLFERLGVHVYFANNDKSGHVVLQNKQASKEEKEHYRKFVRSIVDHFQKDYRFFSVIDHFTAQRLAGWMSESGLHDVLEIGAGMGWWQTALSQHGIKITSTDNFQGMQGHIIHELNELIEAQPSSTTFGSVETEKNRGGGCSPKDRVPVNISLRMAGYVITQDWSKATKQRRNQHDALLLAQPTHPSFIEALQNWGSDKPVLFVSYDGIHSHCELMKKKCHTQPYIPQPDLPHWSGVHGYLKLEVFYWHGADDLIPIPPSM